MSVVARMPITRSLGPWLEAITGRPCGRLQSPPNRPYPYNVLYAIPGGGFEGPALTAPDADASIVFQVNSVALDPAETEALGDGVREAFLGRDSKGAFLYQPPELPGGWRIIDRTPDGGLGGMEYSGAPTNRVFTMSERYVFHLTPSGTATPSFYGGSY